MNVGAWRVEIPSTEVRAGVVWLFASITSFPESVRKISRSVSVTPAGNESMRGKSRDLWGQSDAVWDPSTFIIAVFV